MLKKRCGASAPVKDAKMEKHAKQTCGMYPCKLVDETDC